MIFFVLLNWPFIRCKEGRLVHIPHVRCSCCTHSSFCCKRFFPLNLELLHHSSASDSKHVHLRATAHRSALLNTRIVSQELELPSASRVFRLHLRPWIEPPGRSLRLPSADSPFLSVNWSVQLVRFPLHSSETAFILSGCCLSLALPPPLARLRPSLPSSLAVLLHLVRANLWVERKTRTRDHSFVSSANSNKQNGFRCDHVNDEQDLCSAYELASLVRRIASKTSGKLDSRRLSAQNTRQGTKLSIGNTRLTHAFMRSLHLLQQAFFVLEEWNEWPAAAGQIQLDGANGRKRAVNWSRRDDRPPGWHQ